LESRKKIIQDRYPNWTKETVSEIAEHDYYFSLWKRRLKGNIVFLILASIGTLSLFSEFLWMEPVLAGLLSKWNAVTVYFFKVLTFSFLDWPSWVVNYYCAGIGIGGIVVNMINDMKIIVQTSLDDDPMEHLILYWGCFSFGMKLIYVPFLALIWPLSIIGPIFMILFLSFKPIDFSEKLGLIRIQLKRFLMLLEPFILPIVVWVSSVVKYWIEG